MSEGDEMILKIFFFIVLQGHKKMWIPAKQKCLEVDVKEPLQELKMTAEVKIESDALCCFGQVINETVRFI